MKQNTTIYLTLLLDLSIVPDETGSNRVVCGRLDDLIRGDAERRALNALDLPMEQVGLQVLPFSSLDIEAWSTVRKLVNKVPLSMPLADLRWALAATTGALHWWHIDSDGFGTFISVKTGEKLWIVARSKDRTSKNRFADIGLFVNEPYIVEGINSELWDIEAVLLRAGDTLCVS